MEPYGFSFHPPQQVLEIEMFPRVGETQDLKGRHHKELPTKKE